MDYVADMLDVPRIKVYEVASFYTMYNLEKPGRHLINVCTTTPCWLRGSDDLLRACRDKLGIGPGQTTEDGMFTVREVECMGCCVNAPMVEVADHYHEDLSYDTLCGLIEDLKSGKDIKPGPHVKRQASCGVMGATTLKDHVPAEFQAKGKGG
jgi:NADH-quinone oxidoreductase subunit E